jgi:hypothetical protein
MRLFGISIAAWLTGLGSYAISLWAFWGQTVGGDIRAVLFWSGLATVLSVSIAYGPAMFTIRNRLRSNRFWWLYPSVGVALGVFPTLFIVGSVFSPEGRLFYCMFGSFGVVFGVGFFLAYVRRSV